MTKYYCDGFAIVFLLLINSLYAQHLSARSLSVASPFADHMVLQQKTKAAIWGKGTPGQTVTVVAGWGKQAVAAVDAAGKWHTTIATPKAGGPFQINITAAAQKLAINDVLIGEVWLASGQSNMDIGVAGWPPGDTLLNAQQEVNQANYPTIRFLKVPYNTSAHPLDAANVKWEAISPATAGDYSATGYFFARKLHQELKVPIGIIESSIGGTPAEAWTSAEFLQKAGDFNAEINALDTLQKMQDKWLALYPGQLLPQETAKWNSLPFDDKQAAEPAFDDAGWQSVTLPGDIDRLGNESFDGVVWLRKMFLLAGATPGYTLKIGAVDDMEAIYINGHYIGGINKPGHAGDERLITIPVNVLKAGENVIAIKVMDTGGQGLVRGPILLVAKDNTRNVDLQGSWKWRPVAEFTHGQYHTYGLNADLTQRPEINRINGNSPTVLYNAMINPLVPFTIKGIIWYQGESNVGRAEQYKRIFPLLIQNWRAQWHKQLPFYYVQIAPYLYPASHQKEQSPKLRDAQRYALELPQTGMVSTLDIGYLKTAHPPNKQEVGKRLARLALSKNYGSKMLPSSPVLQRTEIAGNKIILHFTYTGKGLMAAKNGPDNFEIAGADRHFVKASVTIAKNKLLVESPEVSTPLYVRYAWSDGAAATLFNSEGLPASTFTTEPTY